MAFFHTQRIPRVFRVMGKWSTLTPQERANLYVSRTPIAMVTASLGGHAPDGR